jgi:hypothetical protein
MATRLLNPPPGSQAADAIKRRYGTASVAVHTADLAQSDALDCREYRSLAVKPPAEATELTIYGAVTADGEFVLVDATDGIATVVGDTWFVLPAAAVAHGFLKFLCDVAGNMPAVGKS